MLIGGGVFLALCIVVGISIGLIVGFFIGRSPDSWLIEGVIFTTIGLVLGINSKGSSKKPKIGIGEKIGKLVYCSEYENEFVKRQVSTLIPLLVLLFPLLILLVENRGNDSFWYYSVGIAVILVLVCINGILDAAEYSRKKYNQEKHGENIYQRSRGHFIGASLVFVLFYILIIGSVFIPATHSWLSNMDVMNQLKDIQGELKNILDIFLKVIGGQSK